MWRGILLCLAIAAGDDAADVVDVPQQLMSAEKLRRIHQAVDKNKDGKVSVAEVVDFARHMNQVITSKEVQGILNELDKDQDGKLSWQEHLQDLHRFHDPPEDADEEMLKEFETRVAFEKEKFTAADVDKDHFLSPEEAVFLFLPETHPEVLDVVVNDIMKTKDKDADGYLSPQEMWEFSAQEGLSEEAMEDFQKLDKDGNHLLDAQEVRAWESGLFHTESEMLRLIEVADKDGDMEATAEELENAREDLEDSLAQYHLNEWAEHIEL
mmetsp:Transcript_72872/g.160886  ORF Transcript_72872/g.160886 Transcript_72872/m.160886 type:complete len:268 (+) Transcript_72872:44-847(+)